METRKREREGGLSKCALPQPWLVLHHQSLTFKVPKLIYKEMVNVYACFNTENHSHLFFVQPGRGEQSDGCGNEMI